MLYLIQHRLLFNWIIDTTFRQQSHIDNDHSKHKHIRFLLIIINIILFIQASNDLGRQMNIQHIWLLCPQRIYMILLQSKQQRLRYLNKPVFINKNLFSSQAFMRCSIRVEYIQGSTAAIEYTPYITLLKIVFLCSWCPILDFLSQILEGIFKNEIHLEVNGADKILLLLFYLNEREEMLVFKLCTAFEEGL